MDPLISKPQRSPEELRMALENVTRQMIEVENDKRESAKRFNERLKDLRFERDAIVQELGE